MDHKGIQKLNSLPFSLLIQFPLILLVVSISLPRVYRVQMIHFACEWIPDLSIDPHYHPDFRRNPRLNDFGLGEVHSPFNDFSVYDDGLFSGESYRPSFLNRPFFSRGFASSPSFF